MCLLYQYQVEWFQFEFFYQRKAIDRQSETLHNLSMEQYVFATLYVFVLRVSRALSVLSGRKKFNASPKNEIQI
jgi:hypothetical protein